MSLNEYMWLSLSQNAGTLMAESINTVKSREARFGIYEVSINMCKEKYFLSHYLSLEDHKNG